MRDDSPAREEGCGAGCGGLAGGECAFEDWCCEVVAGEVDRSGEHALADRVEAADVAWFEDGDVAFDLDARS